VNAVNDFLYMDIDGLRGRMTALANEGRRLQTEWQPAKADIEANAAAIGTDELAQAFRAGYDFAAQTTIDVADQVPGAIIEDATIGNTSADDYT
jgi:hypothetical protein